MGRPRKPLWSTGHRGFESHTLRCTTVADGIGAFADGFPTMTVPAEGTYTVAELGAVIETVLEQVFPGDVWVAGEIRNLRRANSGHVFFDLVEPTTRPGTAPEASIPVTLFKGMKEIVNRTLRQAGGVRIEDGMLVRIRGAVAFYAPQGRLQLRMTGIDPAYTLGALAIERERLLQRLADEGLLTVNGARPLHPVPLRLALVTSHGSAAAADFLNELAASGLAWQVRLIDTVVQGLGADRSIAGALVLAGRLDVDVVALVRGGGSRTDLVCFDAERVARAIAACPVPVFTGIGHEIDRSVADEVAHTPTKTPTACAVALVGHVRRYVDAVEDRWARIGACATTGIGRAERAAAQRGHHAAALARTAALLPAHVVRGRALQLERLAGRALDRADRRTTLAAAGAADAARGSVDSAHDALTVRTTRLTTRALRPFPWEERRVDALDARARALDPARAIARGWSITRTDDGRVVRSPDDVRPGDTLRTTVAGGTLTSTITATATDPPGDPDEHAR